MRKNIAVLGSTGSVGTQTLEVAEELGINVTALCGGKNISLLENQIRKFKPQIAAVSDDTLAGELKQKTRDLQIKIVSGTEGLCEAAAFPGADTAVIAVSGMIGLEPTLAAINSKKDIALANKETLVAGGELVINSAKSNKVSIIPVDSEHSAVFQCLKGGNNPAEIKKLILTASGGPFFGKSLKELETVTVKDALKHPSWNMGRKITVDSASMMNKGLEVIEAAHLFNFPAENIDVVVHKESVIHSMIEYVDGTVIAQLGVPTMKTPIQYALTYPGRTKSQTERLNLAKYGKLSFFEPDHKTFEAINLCKKAFKEGAASTVALNAANEEAVKLFLDYKIKFLDITALVKAAVNHFKFHPVHVLKNIIKLDYEVREFTKNLI